MFFVGKDQPRLFQLLFIFCQVKGCLGTNLKLYTIAGKIHYVGMGFIRLYKIAAAVRFNSSSVCDLITMLDN